MKRIGPFQYPETPAEANLWQFIIIYRALHSEVLMVAKSRIEGNWSCYCTPVPGLCHEQEKHLWESHGTKVRESIARAIFPEYAEVEYAE